MTADYVCAGCETNMVITKGDLCYNCSKRRGVPLLNVDYPVQRFQTLEDMSATFTFEPSRVVMTFAFALNFMIAGGHRMTREGWNGKGMWVAAQFPDEHSKMGAPYLYINTVEEKLVPWIPSQADLFATDWYRPGSGK